jgi:hypothetical protein
MTGFRERGTQPHADEPGRSRYQYPHALVLSLVRRFPQVYGYPGDRDRNRFVCGVAPPRAVAGELVTSVMKRVACGNPGE